MAFPQGPIASPISDITAHAQHVVSVRADISFFQKGKGINSLEISVYEMRTARVEQWILSYDDSSSIPITRAGAE